MRWVASRESLIAAAKVEHDKVCRCDPKYLMSCSKMAQAVLAQGTAARRTGSHEEREM